MNGIKIVSANTITSLGFPNEEASRRLSAMETGIRSCSDKDLTPVTIPLSRVDTAELEKKFDVLLEETGRAGHSGDYTRIEKMFILSIHDACSDHPSLLKNKDTILVISTTKGNIQLLEERFKNLYPYERLYLWKLADIVAGFFGFVNKPVVISNACISGVVALGYASRLLASGKYSHAIVSGADILSEFVISGFISFQALSPEPCKPFDASRNGLTLGEGAGTIVLSTDTEIAGNEPISISGYATSNDANHISGPSRTGEELAMAIRNAMEEAKLEPHDIDFISAHGTATAYNDEMEAKAITIAGLSGVPVNSFKGYIGHTLGGAGVIECAFTYEALKSGMLYPTAGFTEPGVPEEINVIRLPQKKELKNIVKTASGFGGCNAAIIFRKTPGGK